MLRGGSSYTRLLMREHSKYNPPPGGGVSFDQLAERLESYDELVELSVFVLRRTCRALCVCLKTQDALAELSLAELIESVES